EAAHKSGSRIAGHSYRVELALDGEIDSAGVVAPFDAIERAFATVAQTLDHGLLNDALGRAQPTLENIAIHISERIRADLPSARRVSVFRDSEGEGCHLTFRV